MISATTFPIPSRDNPGGQHVAPTTLSTCERDMRTYGPRNVGHLDLPAKAAASRGVEGSPDPIQIHQGPLPQGGEGMRASGSERWCSLTHKTVGLQDQREETPHQPPAPYSRGERKCSPHLTARPMAATRPTGGSQHGLEVRNGVAGKGPRLERMAKALPSRRGRSTAPIHSSGDSLGIHQATTVELARDRATCPAVARYCPSGAAATQPSGSEYRHSRQPHHVGAGTNSARAERQGWMTSAPFKTAYKCPRTGSRDWGKLPVVPGHERKRCVHMLRSRETNSDYPERESASRVRSIAVHGLKGMPNVSGISSAVLLTSPDPDGVGTHANCSACGCPATFQGRAA